MDKNKMRELIDFINQIEVSEKNVTTNEENENGQFVVVVTYTYNGQSFETKKLYYRNINSLPQVKDPQKINSNFHNPVFWLDESIHQWPKGSGEAEIENTIIKDMIKDGDADFEDFLKRLANNKNDGALQQLTMDGRRKQYGFNLENNNHWHDLINMIKQYIQSKGESIPKEWYNRLVFEWQKEGRVSLDPGLGNRKIIGDLMENIKMAEYKTESEKAIELLEFKKQIILQGPPGTGKTRMAKLIAQEMLKSGTIENLEDHEQFSLIQFHPSYTYEDFVRGIVATPNEDGGGVLYKTENRTLGKFAAKALVNFRNNKKDKATVNKEVLLDQYFKDFVDSISDKIEENEDFLKLTQTVGLIGCDEDAFRYRSKNEGWLKNGNRMLFKDIIQAYNDGNKERKDLKKNNKLSGLARQHSSYFVRVLNLFQSYLKENDLKFDEVVATVEELKPFVLIIDEINRANLPAVLGELIYSLEYRGEALDGMYDIDGDRKIIIPPNLYIIGTMNTADRSVGHIDYAIRRRFAFVDVLPNPEPVSEFAKPLFKTVSELFVKNYEAINWKDPKLERSDYLASDFRPEDVWIGHSYFIAKTPEEFALKLKYEVVPILKEYLKDGILLEKARETIEKLLN